MDEHATRCMEHQRELERGRAPMREDVDLL
jgi:hypothetical protein